MCNEHSGVDGNRVCLLHAVDKRDERPLFYSGRSACHPDVKLHKSAWRNAAVVASNATEPAPHIAKSELQQVEDPDDDALPDTTPDRGQVSQGQKFSQPGPAAM